jgi:L,D-transpeptidase YcbB
MKNLRFSTDFHSPILKIFLFYIFFGSFFSSNAQNISAFKSVMSQEFYAQNSQMAWFSSLKNIHKAKEWLNIIENSDQFGLPVNKTQIHTLQSNLYSPKLLQRGFKNQLDTQITTLVLDFLKAFQEGNTHFAYNEISISRDSIYIRQLSKYIRIDEPVSKIISTLECKDHDYLILKKYLNDSITLNDTFRLLSLVAAINIRRFISLNHQSEYIIVNIPMAQAFYYRNDSLILHMNVVVGKFKKQTPQIASYINSIVTYPYWNVPRSIAVKEILPKVQKDLDYLDLNNLEVINAKGNPINETDLIWENYNEHNFPYYFRQATGPANAMGIIKFNLLNPFSIYLHATNRQSVFEKNDRFLSHGCIRLEKPFLLAYEILRGKFDIEKLKAEKENTKPKTLLIPDKIQTYLIYSTAMVVDEKVVFFPDYYKLLGK